MPEVNVIKEVCRSEYGQTIIIRSELYWDRLKLYLIYFEEAKRDFPDLDLTAEDVQVIIYGGRSQKHNTRGLEFQIGDGHQVPDEYKEVSFTESTL